MKLIPFEIPLLDNPDPKIGLIVAILGEICQNNRYFNNAWLKQTGNCRALLDTLQASVENGLFRSNRKCVIQMTHHTLTLTLNLPQILSLTQDNLVLFTQILTQLETLPSNRFYSDAVLFLDPRAKPKYSDTLNTWVRIYHLWVDIVKPQFGQMVYKSRFDLNPSTGNVKIMISSFYKNVLNLRTSLLRSK